MFENLAFLNVSKSSLCFAGNPITIFIFLNGLINKYNDFGEI